MHGIQGRLQFKVRLSQNNSRENKLSLNSFLNIQLFHHYQGKYFQYCEHLKNHHKNVTRIQLDHLKTMTRVYTDDKLSPWRTPTLLSKKLKGTQDLTILYARSREACHGYSVVRLSVRHTSPNNSKTLSPIFMTM